jgi:glycosyltransferase involved in cell wall biosynthesis
VLSSSKISVLHVGSFLSRSGYNLSFIEELADQMELAGWNIYRTSDTESQPIRLARIATTCWLRRHDYEVAHIAVYSGRAFILAEVASWIICASGRPLVLSLHGGNLPSFARRWPRRVKNLLSLATVVTTPSTYLWEEMRAYRNDLQVLPNSLEVRNYHFEPSLQVKAQLVWLRAFHKDYNPSLAPKVLALLVDDFPDARLTMVGPDKGDGSLQAMEQAASNLGVSDRITLPGGVPKQEVPEWMAKGDIFLNTTNIDNTPISILEAMGCGRCIVSTDVGGIPYLLKHEHNALLVPPDDADAMAAAVRRILVEPGLASLLSRNARQTAEEFDWANILPQWELLITSVANGCTL